MNRINAKRFGPFKLSAGQHIEDVPIGVVAKVKGYSENKVTMTVPDDKGSPHEITCDADSNGSLLDLNGQMVACWSEKPGGGHRRRGASTLKAGEEVELCKEVCYMSPDCEPATRARFPFAIFESFWSAQDLDKLNRPPIGMKFILDVATSQHDEVEALRRQVAELQQRLAEQGGADKVQAQADGVKKQGEGDKKAGEKKLVA